MALTIYKSGQGYWTRMLTAVGAGTIIVSGLAWLIPHVNLDQQYELYVRAGLVVAALAFFGGLLWWILNTPRIADFMIATELEMKKVAWPSRRDLVTYTIVVIVGTLFMALLLWVVDMGFFALFKTIGILDV